MRRRGVLLTVCLAALAANSSDRVFSWDAGRLVAVHGAEVEREGAATVRLRMRSAEWLCGLRVEPPANRQSFDFSSAKWLAVDVENLSSVRQMRLTMHVSSGGANSESADHAAANFTKKRSVNTGIALNPGERDVMRLLLPHPESYAMPDGVRGPLLVDTRHVDAVAFQCQWPFEDEFAWVVDCRLSNIRLEGRPDPAPPCGDKFFPFVDRYGQYRHSEWPGKVRSDSELVEDLAREEAAIAISPRPGSWDRFGGWKDGPQLEPSGNFRVEKVNGRWWFVAPSGHLFFSTGIDVVRDMVDVTDGTSRPRWFETSLPPDGKLPFVRWNLEKKFGRKDYELGYLDFVLRRLDAWGFNTIGNWSASALCMKSRKPYVVSVLERAKGVKRHPKLPIYDLASSDFERQMRKAIRDRFASDSLLCRAAKDAMCIGFFVDNELPFRKWISDVGEERAATLLDRYFRVCREELATAAPGKLYLGSRFVGFRQPGVLWRMAAKHCDVVTVNAYANTVGNLPARMFAKGAEKPILVGEFHFGCLDRGMFRAGLCPVANQVERARSYVRFVEGCLRHPLVVGCHWFQYRDQPLLGRGDGEAYQIGFVDVCDRPYAEMGAAARKIGESIYRMRMRTENNCK